MIRYLAMPHIGFSEKYFQTFVTAFRDGMTSPYELGVGDGTVHVRRVARAVDCGTPVNPSIVEAQIRRAVIFGTRASPLWNGRPVTRPHAAVANAVFAGSRTRLRKLSIDGSQLKAH
jgi:Molybdopterin-binding domain of aldehyde dehydrogenase